MHSQAERLIELPEALRAQFAVLERRLWRVDTVIMVAGALSGLLVSFALLFVSDRFWDTPRSVRILLTGVGLGVLAYFVVGWLRLWVLGRRDTRALATIVQGEYRRLGDRLLGIVELADANKRPANVSEALCKAAIAQVSTEALRFDFRLAVATRKPKLFALAAVFLLLLGLTPCILVPQAGINALARWIWPASSKARFTFVSLENVPDMLVVPHGEAFDIQCGVKYRSFYKPITASCQYERQPLINAPIDREQGRVLFQVPPQTQVGKLRLRIGDVSRTVVVEPTYRPALLKMLADVHMPEYLHYPPQSKEVHNGRLQALEGSQLAFTGKTTRSLQGASMDAEKETRLSVKDTDFTSPPLPLAGDLKVAFSWTDRLKLTNKSPAWVSVAAQKDNPPQVDMPEMARALALLEDEVYPIKLAGTDDYGVKNIGMKLEITLPKSEEIKTVTSDVKTGTYLDRKLDGQYEFSPMILRLPPGAQIMVRATALDYLPGRTPSESPMSRIFIISKEEHAKLVMEEFEKIRAALEELTRRQENLNTDTKQVKDMKPDEMAKAETGKQLGEQANEQADYAKQLERLAQEALKANMEALRNKSIPSETVKDMAQNAEIMQDIASEQMKQAMQALRNAQQAQQSQQQRQQQTNRANDQQQQALDKLQDLLKKMAAALDKMQQKNLADRLKALGDTEKTVSTDLQKILGDTIGLKPGQLASPVRRLMSKMTTEQEKGSKETKKIQDEIQRFFQRTSSDKHESVHKKMEEAKPAEQLLQVADLIKENVGAQAMNQSKDLSEKFFAWAKELTGDDNSGGGGGGGGGGQQMSEEDLAKLLELLRIRETEENLRDQSHLLEVFKKGRETYPEDTTKLAGKQDETSKELAELKTAQMFQKARPFMDAANEAMDDATLKLKTPRTDDQTLNPQTDAMNLLDEAIKAMMPSQQGQGQGQSQQGMMAFMQMLAMGQGQMGQQPGGQSPGGYAGGGPSDLANVQFNGDVKGPARTSRTVEKAGGSGTRVLPAEFRADLQSYFNAVEKPN
jgi:hypothetical protein